MYGPRPGNAEYAALDLTDEQRSRIDQIRQDLRRKQWDLMGRIQDEFASRADAPDDATADTIDDRIGQWRQQMMSNEAAARNAPTPRCGTAVDRAPIESGTLYPENA
jgi:hypothetical protein